MLRGKLQRTPLRRRPFNGPTFSPNQLAVSQYNLFQFIKEKGGTCGICKVIKEMSDEKMNNCL